MSQNLISLTLSDAQLSTVDAALTTLEDAFADARRKATSLPLFAGPLRPTAPSLALFLPALRLMPDRRTAASTTGTRA